MAETKFTTSFIPKKPVQTVASGGRIKKGKTGSIISLISFAVFFIVIIMAVGTFLYTAKLENDIKNQKEQLEQTSRSLDQQLIFEASRLDTRLKVVQKLLDDHLSPSQIFVLLEEFTINNLRFNSMTFSIGGDGNINLSGNGSGVGYESIIQQSDAYGQSEFLRDVIFSGLQGNEQDIINFTFQSVVDPRVINYRETLSAASPSFINQDIQNSQNNQNEDIFEDLDSDPQNDPSVFPQGQQNLNNQQQ